MIFYIKYKRRNLAFIQHNNDKLMSSYRKLCEVAERTVVRDLAWGNNFNARDLG